MMKKKLFGIISLGIVGVLCGGVAYASSVRAEETVVFPEQAYLGETIDIPEKTVEIEGQTVETSILVTAPDGGQYTGNTLYTNQIGLYTLEYYAYVNGKRISLETETLTVVRKAADLFETNAYATVENASFRYDDEVKGVRASLSTGGKITFSKIFSASDFTKDTALIEMIAEGSKEGSPDYTNLTITLTDIEDPNNAVNVYMVDSGANCFGKGTYVRVGATGQVAAGYEGTTLNALPQFGTPIWHTFKKQEEGHEYRTAKLYFDYASKAMYVSDDFFVSRPQTVIVADMDNPSDFSSIWSGFTSGKARLSITAAGLSAATADLVITKVLGYDLSQDDFKDELAPELSIDYAGESSVPVAILGSSYRVFDAVVEDNLDNEIKLDVFAYYQHTESSRKIDVEIKDGYIRTDFAGIYTLYYKATDCSGNVSETSVQIPCAAIGEEIVLETSDFDKEVQAYDQVRIGGVASVTAEGGSGNLKITAEVFDPDGSSVKLIKDSFRAEKIGAYRVVYTAIDYLGNSAQTETTVTVSAPVKPIFTEELFLPDMLIKGFVYELPEFPAKEVIDGEIKSVPVAVYVNGEEVKNGSFEALTDTVNIKYVATGNNGTTEYSIDLPVTDVNNGKDQEKYFYGENIDSILNERDYVVATFATDANLAFANLLQANKFSVGFTFGENDKNFSVMKVKLTDANNKNITVTLTLIDKDGQVYLQTPHNPIEGKFTASQGVYELIYKNNGRTLSDKNANICGTVLYDDNGDPFEGFSGGVYMSMEFESVVKASAVRLTLLNNQTLGYRTSKYDNRRDKIEPEIYLQESYAVKNTLGATAKVSAGNAYDVLGYIKSFTVSVTAPSGKSILKNASAREFYEFKLEEYGDYRVEYVATDSNGSTYSESRLISVVERVLPTLKTTTMRSEYKVGDAIKIPEYQVSDNSVYYSLDVMLIMPDNDMRLLIHDENGEIISKLSKDDVAYEAAFKVDNQTFRVQTAGEYILRFFAYDENFNYVTVEHVFTVKV